MIVSRAHLQHDVRPFLPFCVAVDRLFHYDLQLRQVERSMSVLTPLHLTLIKDVLRMSVSEYALVQCTCTCMVMCVISALESPSEVN